MSTRGPATARHTMVKVNPKLSFPFFTPRKFCVIGIEEVAQDYQFLECLIVYLTSSVHLLYSLPSAIHLRFPLALSVQ